MNGVVGKTPSVWGVHSRVGVVNGSGYAVAGLGSQGRPVRARVMASSAGEWEIFGNAAVEDPSPALTVEPVGLDGQQWLQDFDGTGSGRRRQRRYRHCRRGSRSRPLRSRRRS
jgi:hypothetical protein